MCVCFLGRMYIPGPIAALWEPDCGRPTNKPLPFKRKAIQTRISGGSHL